MAETHDTLQAVLDHAFSVFSDRLRAYRHEPSLCEIGTVASVGQGIARIRGLPGVQADELVRFAGDRLGLAFNLDLSEIGVVLLDESTTVEAGAEVRRTGRVLDTPVGESLLGRVVDALGRPLDARGPVSSSHRSPVERDAPGILERAAVTAPLQTGLKVVDALIPIGRGQRELILGDRQIGKTALAVDTIINQKDQGVMCIYCAIGQRSSAVAHVIADLRQHDAMDYCTVVVATGEDPPGLQFVAPFAAMTMAEYFMEQGRDALVVFDDLTKHARAYRELSLLLRRPPGREAFPGDIFYLHSRLLERATHLNQARGGGSVTALPIIETEAQNIAAYIPTNLISITDGQVYLSPQLFQKGILPAVDVGKSVSRVGGKAQLAAYRAVSGTLRLSYSQFEELEAFSRFGARLDEDTRQTLEHGRRVRAVLQQPQYARLTAPEQIAILVAVTHHLLDAVPPHEMGHAETAIRRAVLEELPDLCDRIAQGQALGDTELNDLRRVARRALAPPEEHMTWRPPSR